MSVAQVGGGHYAASYQHWDFVVEAFDNRYMEGQITKYVIRWREKNGVEDLRKARSYAAKTLEVYLAGLFDRPSCFRGVNFVRACIDKLFNGMGKDPRSEEGTIFFLAGTWQSADDLKKIVQLLDEMIERTEGAAATPAYVAQG